MEKFYKQSEYKPKSLDELEDDESLFYPKTFKTYEEQIELLKSRKLRIDDELKAIKILKSINYYRLSVYFLPFQYPKNSKNKDIFKRGTRFEDIIELYYLDVKLRNFLIFWLLEIECILRTKIAYTHAKYFGGFGYLEADNFKDVKLKKKKQEVTFYNEVMRKIKQELHKTKEEFIKHFKNKYKKNYPPIWVWIEIVSFDTLLKIFKLMYAGHKREVLGDLDLEIDTQIFENWLENLIIMRNSAAHCGRIWNKHFMNPFIYPKNQNFLNTSVDNQKIFFGISIMAKMIKNPEIKIQFKSLLEKYIETYGEAMGIPLDWEELEPWKSL